MKPACVCACVTDVSKSFQPGWTSHVYAVARAPLRDVAGALYSAVVVQAASLAGQASPTGDAVRQNRLVQVAVGYALGVSPSVGNR